MTRAVAGIVALDGLYVLVGALLLDALGLLDIRKPRLSSLGLALVTGWALTGVAVATIITLGAPVNVAVVGAVVAALAAGSLLLRGRIPRPAPTREHGRRSWHENLVAATGGAVVILSLGCTLVVTVSVGADRNWDAWAFWLAKAKTLVYFGGLDTETGGFTSFANAEYPPLAPALDAATFAFMGGVAPAYVTIQHWAVTAAFFGALVALLAPRVPPYALWPALAALAAAPAVRALASSVIADLQVAIVLALAAVLLAIHLVELDARLLAAASVFLAAAALLKTEGFVLGVALAVVGSLLSLRRGGSRRAVAVAALAVVPIVALVPWKLWLRAHGVPLASSVYDYELILRPVELADRLPRLTYASKEMLELLANPAHWLLLAPAVVAGAVLVIVRGSRLGLAAAAWLAAAFFVLASAYWLGTVDLYWHVDTSAARVVTSVAVAGGALLPLLLAELGRGRSAAPAPSSATRAGGED